MPELLVICLAGLPGWAKAGATPELDSAEQIGWIRGFPDAGVPILTQGRLIWLIKKDTVFCYDLDGSLIARSERGFSLATGLAFNEQTRRLCVASVAGLYILDTGASVLFHQDIRKTYGIPPQSGSGFLFLSACGDGFVLSSYNKAEGNALNLFDRNGEFIASFGEPVDAPDKQDIPAYFLCPVGIAAGGDFVLGVNPYTLDLLIYENETLTHEVNMGLPKEVVQGAAPRVDVSVSAGGDSSMGASYHAVVRTEIRDGLALVWVRPDATLSRDEAYLLAVDVKKGKVLNTMRLDMSGTSMSFLGLDPDGGLLFWSREGIFRVPVIPRPK